MLVLYPVATISAIWALELDDARIALMPVVGLLAWLVGGTAGLLFGRALKLDRPQAGVYFTSSAMFNMGRSAR